jgi:hypothetical protein
MNFSIKNVMFFSRLFSFSCTFFRLYYYSAANSVIMLHQWDLRFFASSDCTQSILSTFFPTFTILS